MYYQHKDIVAGDFYWVEQINEDLTLFAAADCTGHGVPGALVSVICANALNRAVNEFSLTKPGDILDKVTQLVIQSFERSEEDIKDGMDIALCAIDRTSNKLYFAGANNPLWLVTKARQNSGNKYISDNQLFELIEFKGNKQPVGKNEEHINFETHEIELQNGDMIYLFSDGFPDQFGGERGKKYKYANFKRFSISTSKSSVEEQERQLATEFKMWKKGYEQLDDVCIIGVRV